MKTRTTNSPKVQEMASEYRFDYGKAKPNRFAEKTNLNVNWMVERFVGEAKPKAKTSDKKPAAKNTTTKKASKTAKKKKK